MFNTAANTPESEIQMRIQQLQHEMTKAGLDGILILQNSDLYYFCGTMQQAHLYVPVEGSPILMAKKSIQRARAESPMQTIVTLKSPAQLPDILKAHNCPEPRTLGMELDVLPVNLYQRYLGLWPNVVVQDCSLLIRQLRAVKSPFEIDLIRQAAGLADRMAAFAATVIREGVPEIEIAGILEAETRRLGHQGLIRMRLWGSELFYGHFMSGWSAAVPSSLASPTGGAAMSPAFAQGPGMKKIERGEPILFDYVFTFQGYLADHTRIYCLGQLPDKLVAAHETMLELQALIALEARPGKRAHELYDLALDFVTRKGYETFFMGGDDQRVGFIGHGIGLELDEFPFIAAGQKMTLQEGMIIALEPKLIFPGQGVVGIENTHLVTKDGLERLTCFDDGIIAL